MSDFQIDPEFRAQIPPPTDEELKELERAIAEHGVRDPLVVGKIDGTRYLLDGHNRHAIAQRLGVAYRTVQYDFATRESAADWIDRNQLGRRNLSPDQMSLLRGRRYNRLKGPGHGSKSGYQFDTQNAASSGGRNRTRAALAAEHGVTEGTIHRDAQFATAVEQLKPTIPDIERKVIAGELTRKAVRAAAAEPERAQEILAPKSKGNGLAPGVKRLPAKPLAERLQRAVANIVSAVDALEMIDFSPLIGGDEGKCAADSLTPARAKLSSFINSMKGR